MLPSLLVLGLGLLFLPPSSPGQRCPPGSPAAPLCPEQPPVASLRESARFPWLAEPLQHPQVCNRDLGQTEIWALALEFQGWEARGLPRVQPVLQDAGGGAKPQQEVVWEGVEIRARRAAGPRCPRNESCKETSSGGEQSRRDTTPLLPRYVRKRHRASRTCGFGGRSTVSLSVGKRGLGFTDPPASRPAFSGK